MTKIFNFYTGYRGLLFLMSREATPKLEIWILAFEIFVQSNGLL